MKKSPQLPRNIASPNPINQKVFHRYAMITITYANIPRPQLVLIETNAVLRFASANGI